MSNYYDPTNTHSVSALYGMEALPVPAALDNVAHDGTDSQVFRLGTEDPTPFVPTAENIAPWESIEDYGWMVNGS